MVEQDTDNGWGYSWANSQITRRKWSSERTTSNLRAPAFDQFIISVESGIWISNPQLSLQYIRVNRQTRPNPAPNRQNCRGLIHYCEAYDGKGRLQHPLHR